MGETARTKSVVGTFASGSTHGVGDGFHVRNMFPSNALGERLSPFLLLDLAGPTRYSPTATPRGVGEHPHRGFETVTLVYQGRLAHRDSAGNSGVVGPGDVQWMTAASGVVHEEKHEEEFARQGGTLQMAQLWVNLPAKHKLSRPRYQDLAAAEIPSVEVSGGHVRVVAGEFRGTRGPAETFTALNVWDVRLAAGGEVEVELPPGHNAGVVVFTGRARVNETHEIADAEMAWLDVEGERVRVQATDDSEILLLSGEPLGEPVVAQGPFVMNTGQEIYQAVKDFQSGKMGRLDAG